MKRIFVHRMSDYTEKTVVDMDTEEVCTYRVTNDGIVYSESKWTAQANGWASLKEFLQKRYRYNRYADPRKGIKRAGYVEVDYEEEIEREKAHIIRSAASYIEGCFSTNPEERALQEKQIALYYSSLERYGLDADAAEKAVLAELTRRHVPNADDNE